MKSLCPDCIIHCFVQRAAKAGVKILVGIGRSRLNKRSNPLYKKTSGCFERTK